MQLLATPFSGVQLALIIIVSLICLVLFAGNAALIFLFFHKRTRSKMANVALQQRREQLLEELYNLKQGNFAAAFDDEEEDADEIISDTPDDEAFQDDGDEDTVFAEDDDAEGDDGTEAEISDTVGTERAFNAEILAVKDMSAEMRERFGFVGDGFKRKRYYISSRYSFEAKLGYSADEIKQRYTRIICELKKYSRLNGRLSFRRERFYIGRKTVALLLFKGKKLCIALALDPNEYKDTRYRGEDVSDKKCFASTPMLIRLTSERRLENVIYLISELAARNGATPLAAPVTPAFNLARKSRNRLFAENKLKITILGEAPELDADEDDADETVLRAGILAVNDMSDQMREKFGFVGKEYAEKRYYVRYNYSFEAKLRTAKDVIKLRYTQLIGELGLYKKLRISPSFRNVRISYRKKTVGIIFFKGKTLCVALALDPKEFEETKYRGEDLSDKKRFKATPMGLKLTSLRRLGYAKYLLTKLAEEKGIEFGAVYLPDGQNYSNMTRNELFAHGLIKINVIGEVPQ